MFVKSSVFVEPVDTNLSDHRAVSCSIARPARHHQPQTRYVRKFSKSNQCNFVAAIDSVDWAGLNSRYTDVGDRAQSVIRIIVNAIEKCFPLKKLGHGRRDTWVTSEILNMKSLLNDINVMLRKFPDDLHLSQILQNYTTKYERMLRERRSDFYVDKIYRSSNAIKTMWSIVNEESGRKLRSNTDYTDLIKTVDGNAIKSKTMLVDAVNARFVGAAGACGAPPADVQSSCAALTAARAASDRCLRLRQFTPFEVHQLITKRIARKPTKDFYDISIELLYLAANSLSGVLAQLYNECLRTGSYPLPLKKVKVSPLFKGKGKRDDVNNYRPVSIIPGLAKILEAGLSERLIAFLTGNESLSDRQYAYRSGKSTTSAAREVIRRILEAKEQKQQVAVLFCDLSKAFDVANHKLLAAKIKHYGIAGPPQRLLIDFLQERSQIVVGEGGQTRSSPLDILLGVPQGSSVSNILFSILMNDLPEAIQEGHVLMYADDVAAVVSAPSTEGLESNLNIVASKISNWFKINGLILNLAKTQYIHFNLSGRANKPLQVQ